MTDPERESVGMQWVLVAGVAVKNPIDRDRSRAARLRAPWPLDYDHGASRFRGGAGRDIAGVRINECLDARPGRPSSPTYLARPRRRRWSRSNSPTGDYIREMTWPWVGRLLRTLIAEASESVTRPEDRRRQGHLPGA